ncbi:hypothetical protein ACFPTO_18575 [Paraburkholderia denitrificans]|uniref:Uncharacterized protein n=1 Tax=Paraburkholderia denitrificans TaxID=694025 RepID=A0ABW0JCA1_9BURK
MTQIHTYRAITRTIFVGGITVFGIIAAGAGVLALFSWLMFDAPNASRNVLTWNMAIALFCYPIIYVRGLPKAINAVKTAEKRALGLWLLGQVCGVGWLGISYGLLDVVCHGNFACR